MGMILACAVLFYTAIHTHSQPVEDFSKDTPHQVLRIIDGDTVEIQYNDIPTRVRLIGMDTPELAQEYGEESLNFARNLLLGEAVYLRFDGNREDRYGRLRAYLYRAPDGLFVNLEIVRQGYGTSDTAPRFQHKHTALFQHYGDRARQAGKGLHDIPAPDETVTVYRTRTGAKYHRESCRYLSRSKIPIALEDAKYRYGACRVCNPPR
jgi:micrococcal nuclease